MASIITRKDRFCVVYSYVDAQGKRHQKWETFLTMADAQKRKTKIEYNTMTGSFTTPNSSPMLALLDPSVTLYGQTELSPPM